MDHPYLTTGHLVPADPAHAQGLHVIESFKRVGWQQRAHVGFALAEPVLRRERLNGCVGYFIRRLRSETAPEHFSPGGKALAHLLEVLTDQQLPDRQLGRHLWNAAPAAGRSRSPLPGGPPTWCGRGAASRSARSSRQRPGRTAGSRSRKSATSSGCRGSGRLALERRRPARARPATRGPAGRGPEPGLGTLIDDPADDDSGWPRSMAGGKHHMGTTRMHSIRSRAWSIRTAGCTGTRTSTLPAAPCFRPRATPTRR